MPSPDRQDSPLPSIPHQPGQVVSATAPTLPRPGSGRYAPIPLCRDRRRWPRTRSPPALGSSSWPAFWGRASTCCLLRLSVRARLDPRRPWSGRRASAQRRSSGPAPCVGSGGVGDEPHHPHPAFRHRPEYASAVPWVVGVARNVLAASRRRSRVEDRARRRLGLRPIELDDADLEHVRALADSELSRVTELLEQLPEDERAAVRAGVVDEHSYTEIAMALRCSEMVARKRVSRGLARMRARLQERP